jgi:DNA helicase-2/ATP-dependent DNA helicase PcrA
MLQNLNSEQLTAVQTTDGPLLVLSGAGTGKTRVLTTRVAYILNQGLCKPWQILALTFTNKAANEMKNRLANLSDGTWYSGDIWCGTFHSICLRILRKNAALCGLRSDFIIFGEDDQKSVIKSLITAGTKTPGDYVEDFSAIKDKGLVALQNKDKLFNAYNAELARLNAVDFGDIILKVLELFDKNPTVLAFYQNQFKYILVDEFQDTNNAQMELLTMLTRGIENPNICCVGDDDQSIYSWRGAEIKHILNFNKTFANAQIIRLETNYRSTANILGAANSLIRHNQGRLGKDLRVADANVASEQVYVLTLPSDRDEAHIIADAIVRNGDGDYNKFAVLVRSDKYWLSIEKEFIVRGIPYRVVGNKKFYERAEIKDVIALIRLLVQPSDDVSFLRMITKPRRGFGDKAIATLRASGENLMSGLRNAKLSAKQRTAADEFLSVFDFDWSSMLPKDAVRILLKRSKYFEWLDTLKDVDVKDKIEKINFLIEKEISEYDTLCAYLDHALLDSSNEDEGVGNFVCLMTIHAAKGLEFDTVFLPAWEEGVFPNEKSIKNEGLEEERRLAYVGITRAVKRCIISCAESRWLFDEVKHNCPSRFIAEMDNRFLDFQGGTVSCRPKISPQYTPTPKPTPRVQASIVGKLVTHDELGSGVVIEDKGDIITVAFKTRGIKKVARNYLHF